MKKIATFLLSSVLLSGFGQKSGIVLSNMDKKENPGNDFYMYCNGSWQKSFKLPESDSRYGSFNEIHNNNLKNIKKILDAALLNKTAKANSDEQKLHDFYSTAMDSVKAEKLGITPIQAQLDEIEKIKDLKGIVNLKNSFGLIGINLFFNGGVGVDAKNSKRNIYEIGQDGFGLHNRDFYYNPQFEKIQKAYINYLSELFVLSGTNSEQANKMAQGVFDFEKKLTEKAFTSLEMRNVERMYNIYTPNMMNELAGNINWTDYFKALGTKQPDTCLVGMIDYMKAMNELLSSTSIEDLKNYSKAHLLNAAAPFLSSKFEETHFNFYGKVLSGAKAMKPRWERAESVVDRSIGHALSREFVKKYFPPASKAKLDKLIDNLILAYRDRIDTRTWMSAETKKAAHKKLDLLIRKIGYPDKWDDYSSLTIGTNNYWENVCAANKFKTIDNISDLNKPVDRYKWQMTPVTVNAYYNPTTNEITFPAAILQPPFFDAEAEDAANYGTMGSIIGHELSHGFDDQGSQFDADGNMKMWWTEQDFENFKNKKQGIITQFDSYIAIDTLHVNGSMTQGENIADLGGLTMAYHAYQKSLNGKPSKVMDGFTGEQRFFIAWAQGWKQICRDEELKRLITVDYHSPAFFRAFAPLSNMSEFYKAFNVKEGDKMYRPEKDRVEIW
ncbi:MAG: M13 family metallopeptidase [Sphingobacteriaceae bacterium]|nr:M13 family metallopeptidase [Sphingobacteriaceae bacterium]